MLFTWRFAKKRICEARASGLGRDAQWWSFPPICRRLPHRRCLFIAAAIPQAAETGLASAMVRDMETAAAKGVREVETGHAAAAAVVLVSPL